MKLIFTTQKHTYTKLKKIFFKKISYHDSMAKQPHKGHKPPTISTFWSKLQIRWNVITLTYPEFQIFFKPFFLYLKNISQPQQQKMFHTTHWLTRDSSRFHVLNWRRELKMRAAGGACEQQRSHTLTYSHALSTHGGRIDVLLVETYQKPGYIAGPTGWLETGAGRQPWNP